MLSNVRTRPPLSLDAAEAARRRAPSRRAPSQEFSDRFSPDTARWFVGGNKVTPLFDASVTPRNREDEIFRQVKLAIDTARRAVQLEMFGFGQMDIARALVGAQDRGVQVQVVLDPVNEEYEQEKQEVVDYLRGHGVDLHFYPVERAGGKYPQIAHAKLLIVDGEKAIIGGMNWGSHSPLNHDVDVLVEGPAVDKMEYMFGKDYLKSGGRPQDLIPVEETPPHPEGNSYVSLVTSSADPRDRSMAAALSRAIRTCRKKIYAELFVLSDRRTVDELIEAHRRGVDVRILLNPLQIEDNRVNEWAAARLSAAGVPVRWFKVDGETGGKLHAKMGIFDDEEVIVGSANWSKAGLTYNREAGVDIFDRAVAATYRDMFLQDWQKGTDEPIYPEQDSSPQQ